MRKFSHNEMDLIIDRSVFLMAIKFQDGKTVSVTYCNNLMDAPNFYGIIFQLRKSWGNEEKSNIHFVHTNSISAQTIHDNGGLFSYADIRLKVLMALIEFLPATFANFVGDMIAELNEDMEWKKA